MKWQCGNAENIVATRDRKKGTIWRSMFFFFASTKYISFDRYFPFLEGEGNLFNDIIWLYFMLAFGKNLYEFFHNLIASHSHFIASFLFWIYKWLDFWLEDCSRRVRVLLKMEINICLICCLKAVLLSPASSYLFEMENGCNTSCGIHRWRHYFLISMGLPWNLQLS